MSGEKAYGEVHSRRRLFVALLMSIAVHAAVIALLMCLPSGALVATDSAGGVSMLSVRFSNVMEAVTPELFSGTVPEQMLDAAEAPAAIDQPAISESANQPAVGANQRPALPAAPNKAYGEDKQASATDYFAAEWLARRPIPLFPVTPKYPADVDGVTGAVSLLLLINEKGGVDGFRILTSEPPGVFDQASIEAFTRARYAPGRIGGHPVKSEFVVEIFFESGDEPRVGVVR